MISYLTPIYLDFHTVLDVTWNSELNFPAQLLLVWVFYLSNRNETGAFISRDF